MEIYSLDKMIKGWFIGNINPTVLTTEDCEVAVKSYKSGDSEETHFHKIATEITVIISGRVRIGNHDLSAGDIIKILPNEAVDFYCYEDAITTVVKIPGALNDKYIL